MLNTRGFGFSVLMLVVMVLVAIPVTAAPAIAPARAGVCSAQRSAHALGVDGGLTALRMGQLPAKRASSTRPLGVDGGLTGLSRGEFALVPAVALSARPSGVDGGLTSLLFARSEASGVAAYAAVSCGSVSAGS